jgi:hypothetical protein
LFGHLWEVELTYRYIFAFKFTLKSQQQPDIVPIFAAGVADTGGKSPLVLLTPAANLPPVPLTPVANLPPLSTTLAKQVVQISEKYCFNFLAKLTVVQHPVITKTSVF